MTDQEQAELADLEQQIAKANADAAEIETRRAPSALDMKRAELAAAKRKVEDAAVVERLEAIHGKMGKRLASVNTDAGMLVIRAPKRMEWKQFNDGATAGAQPLDRQESFVKTLLVWPEERGAQTEILHQYPAIMSSLTNLATELGGFQQVTLQGK